MDNTGRMSGVFTAVVIGLIIWAVVVRLINRNKRMITEYDEMQKLIRGRGYMYAFYTVIIYEALMCVFTVDTKIPAEGIVIHYLGIFLGITVHAAYCIWHDAYVGINTNLKRYVILLAIISIFNLGVAFMAWREGELFAGGVFRAQTVNLLCGLMFAVLGAVGLVKMIARREEDE